MIFSDFGTKVVPAGRFLVTLLLGQHHYVPPPISRTTNRLKTITIPAELVPTLLSRCREQMATLTGLIHGLIVTSLSLHVPEASNFSSTTPYSLRHLTGMSPTREIGNQVCSHTSKYSKDLITRIRSCNTAKKTTLEIWGIARNFRASMAAELANLPNDNMIGLVPYISNLHKMVQSRIGKPRPVTYELSNVGSFVNEDSSRKWKIERDLFSQSGMVTGPPVGFNVASVSGGPLCITICWLQGDIEESLVDHLARDVGYGLKSVGEGKEIAMEF